MSAPPLPDGAERPTRRGRNAGTWAAYALVLALTVLLGLWGAFLVPLRVGATLLPVSWLIAAGAPLVLGRAGAVLLGRRGALGPAVLWLGLALVLGAKRTEGDLIIPGTTSGLVYLVVGAVSCAVAYALAPAQPTR